MPPETSAWVSPLVMAGVVGRDKPGHDGSGTWQGPVTARNAGVSTRIAAICDMPRKD